MPADQRLTALSPLDGRYAHQLQDLGHLLGEQGLIGARIRVEIEWLLHIFELPEFAACVQIPPALREKFRAFGQGDLSAAAQRVKEIESTTKHDVKAVEYFLREYFEKMGAPAGLAAFIHFACTSEDINNLSYALILNDSMGQSILPALGSVIQTLGAFAEQFADVGMLARTHGQPATPTTLGKEMAVFASRLQERYRDLRALKMLGKMNGAVGNFNAHVAAFPTVDWLTVSRTFVEKKLGLAWNPYTTQIENHDSIVSLCQTLHHANAVGIGFCRDIWGYISLGYFRQIPRAGEVGSSTMPHKINPIDFENAEGNLGMANALAHFFEDKLPISRWQRDLSDSTVLRNLGVFLGHTTLGYKNISAGLGKLAVDQERIHEDLAAAWELLAEPVQTVMRRYQVTDAYEKLKTLTRGKALDQRSLHAFIDQCQELPDSEKQRLKKLTPPTYLGMAATLARRCASEIREAHP